MSNRERRARKRGRALASATALSSAPPLVARPTLDARAPSLVAPSSEQRAIATLPAQRREALLALAIFALAGVLLFAWTNTLPGVHGDEAWVITRAKQIAQGEHSLDGMNYYTGALFPSLSFIAAELFGYRVAVIRGLSAVLNLGALALIMSTVRKRHTESQAWLWTGLLTASAIPFVLESRLATEITALAPLLVASGLCLLQYAFRADTASRQLQLAVCSGLAFVERADRALLVAWVAVVHRRELILRTSLRALPYPIDPARNAGRRSALSALFRRAIF